MNPVHVSKNIRFFFWFIIVFNQEIAFASDFKDTAAPRFGHSDVVFDLFIETRFFSHLIALLSNFPKLI